VCLDFFTKSDAKMEISRIEVILGTGIFNNENTQHPLLKSAFTEMLIILRDLMYKTEKFTSRISFTDNIVITPKVKDVTDLIKYIRDALCHEDSDNHYMPNATIKSNFNISNDYSDICFHFGEQVICLERHILRAFNEAKEKLLPLL
jgi:hypothetical protein